MNINDDEDITGREKATSLYFTLLEGRSTAVVPMAHAQKSAKGGAGGGKAAPKKKGPSAAKKVDDDREETLQAVVCAALYTGYPCGQRRKKGSWKES